jgi:cytochrome oxidase Cu insertion factor (SCO1/SenC/PrrC family)
MKAHSLIALSLLSMLASVGHAGGREMIAVGERFVDFELESNDGTTVSSTDLEGRPYLLFFYPKAGTPG